MTAERDVDRMAGPSPAGAVPVGVPVASVGVPVAPGPSSEPAARDVPGAGPLRALPPLAAPAVPRPQTRRRTAPGTVRPGPARGSRAARPVAGQATPPPEPLTASPAELERLRAIAEGEVEADFAVRGGVVFVVQTGEMLQRDILISGRFIAAVTRPGVLGARRSLDAAGRFVLPAYVDARTSVERTLLSPGELARLSVPRGTVTVLTDPTQVEQLCGPRGRSLVLRSGTPVRVLPRAADPASDLARSAGPTPAASPGHPSPVRGAAGNGREEVVDVSRAVPRQVNPHSLAPGQSVPPRGDAPVSPVAAPGPVAGPVSPGPLDGAPLPAAGPAPSGPLIASHLAPVGPPPPGPVAAVVAASLVPGAPAGLMGHVYSGLEVPPVGGAIAPDHLDERVREEIRAGAAAVRTVCDATLTPARAHGLDHVLGSIAPAHLADLQIVQDLTSRTPPDVVIAGGRIAAERGRPLFDNLDTVPPWALSSVRLPAGLYTGSFTSPCMHWATRRDTRLSIVDVRPAPAGVPQGGAAAAGDGHRRPVIARVEPTLQDGTVVADPSRDLLKSAVLDRTGRPDGVRVGVVRGIGLTRGALGATAAAAPSEVVIVGTGDADMLTAARALEGMGGGFVVVDRGWVLAACPLPIAGLMSDAPWEAVLGQLAAVDTAARELGCRLASPLRLIAELGRDLYVRP